ncbi:hypothetical protein DYB26_009137 [Aphanomyces astaci]|uniref:Uncharacterized protein n=1 Tax=Aphanomyces astaci TaxID=112090 RepID=A0A3R6ZAZ7_APHAT|nr:hypothetical protein DYB26_009137 [Aphanomyces astaci]
MEYALKSLVLLGVIVTLNYSISRLQVQSGGMRWQQNGNVPQHYAHLERMWHFRLSLVAYLVLPSVVVLLNAGVVNPPGTWRNYWVSCLNEELFLVGVYCHMAYTLRPISPAMFQLVTSRPTVSFEVIQ